MATERNGRKKNIEKLIPYFTVEIHLRKLTLSQQVMINKSTAKLFGCDRTTFYRIRFAAAAAPGQSPEQYIWTPKFITVQRIADYFGVPVDALINRTRQKIIEGEQLRIIDTETGSTQLEINTKPQKKKATA